MLCIRSSVSGIALYPLPLSFALVAYQHFVLGSDSLRCEYSPAIGHFVRLTPTEIALSSLPLVKQIHHSVTAKFTKSPWYACVNDADASTLGVFAMLEVKQHTVLRKLFALSFTNTVVLKYEGLVRSKVSMAVEKIKRDALGEEGVADILKWYKFMTSDIIGELCFGWGFDSLIVEEVGAVLAVFVTCWQGIGCDELTSYAENAIHQRSPDRHGDHGSPRRDTVAVSIHQALTVESHTRRICGARQVLCVWRPGGPESQRTCGRGSVAEIE